MKVAANDKRADAQQKRADSQFATQLARADAQFKTQLGRIDKSVKAANRQADQATLLAKQTAVEADAATKTVAASNALATASQAQAGEAKEAVRQARIAAADARANFAEEERPWIFVVSTPVTLSPTNDALTATAQLGNYGRTPALQTTIIAGLYPGSAAVGRAKVEQFFEHPGRSSTTFVSQMIVPPVGIGGSTPVTTPLRTPVSPIQGRTFMAIDSAIYVYGVVTYTDHLGGKPHRTEFCYERQADGAMLFCHNHNVLR